MLLAIAFMASVPAALSMNQFGRFWRPRED
jgi:hypothetical protein